MIKGIYLLKSNGDVLFETRFADKESGTREPLPPHVRSCVTLFTSRESTEIGHPYILEQNDDQWIYVFFQSVTVLALVTKDEDVTSISRRMAALGKRVVQNYGKILDNWHGNMSSIEGLEQLVLDYITSRDADDSDETLKKAEDILYSVLEEHDLAFAGIIDAKGDMVAGNIPDAHLQQIRNEVLQKSVSPSTEIVPTTYDILGYNVQAIQVHSFTVVGAPHKEDSRVAATSVISEIAHALNDIL